MRFKGGRIDAQILCEGEILRTAEPVSRGFGLAQARRLLGGPRLSALHVVFAPLEPRPLLLGLVRLRNGADEPLIVSYTELWEVRAGSYRTAPGAAELSGPEGVRALAEVGSVIRARAPEPAPSRGLALDLCIPLPPRATRYLSFAYAAPEPGEEAGALVSSWRGDAATELARAVRGWRQRLGDCPDPIGAYRREAGSFPHAARPS